jgi:hypothetical protein
VARHETVGKTHILHPLWHILIPYGIYYIPYDIYYILYDIYYIPYDIYYIPYEISVILSYNTLHSPKLVFLLVLKWRQINSIFTINRGLETGEGRAFNESFQPFRAEPHKFYIFRQYTNIVFILRKKSFGECKVL